MNLSDHEHQTYCTREHKGLQNLRNLQYVLAGPNDALPILSITLLLRAGIHYF